MITKIRVKNFADCMDFDVVESVQKISLRAKFKFSDGYRPSTIPLTTKEVFVYLQGFSDGIYE